MNFRKEWQTEERNNISNDFYSKQETVDNVVENFDIRRKHSAEGKKITVNNVADWCLVQTPLNPLKEFNDYRKIHCPMAMDVKRGYYVFYENDVWLIDSNVIDVDGAYQTARMNRCSYILKWQNKKGDIIERNVVSYNASAYNNGVREGKVITIGTDQLMLFLPYDDETKNVQRGKKFFIDNNMDDPMTYELTRPDRTTYVFNGIGYICWLVTECEYTATLKELECGVCNYFSPTLPLPTPPMDESSILSEILYKSSTLKIGKEREFAAVFYDADKNSLSDIVPVWKLVCSFDEVLVSREIDGNIIKLKVSDNSLIDESFLLQLISEDESSILSEIKIKIENYY